MNQEEMEKKIERLQDLHMMLFFVFDAAKTLMNDPFWESNKKELPVSLQNKREYLIHKIERYIKFK
jgi:hypothetical protein